MMKSEEVTQIVTQCTRMLLKGNEPLVEVQGITHVDVHFFTCVVNTVSAETHRGRLMELLAGYPWGETGLRALIDGPNYLEVGAALGDQGAALRLFGLGQVLGFWKVVTPQLLGYSDAGEAEEVAGMGLVLVTGYSP